MATKLQLSDFRCPITVKGRVLTVDAIGDSVTTWVERGQTWACIEDMSKGESYRAMRTEALVGQRVIIRKGTIPPVEGTPEVPVVPYTAGYLLVDFSVPLTDVSDPTGLPDDDTIFPNTFAVDGAEYPIVVAGQDAQTYEALIALVEAQAPVTGSIEDGALRFTSQTTGHDSYVSANSGDDGALLVNLANWNSTVTVAGEGNDGTPAIPGSVGLTVDDVVVYDGRTMPIKAINNLVEGNVAYQELLCVQGDPTGPGL